MASHGDQIGEHRVADRRGHFSIGQGIQSDVDDRALSDRLHPVEDGSGICQVRVVGRQQLCDLAAGQLLQQWQEAGDNLVEVGLVVPDGRAQAVEHRVVVASLGEVLLQRHDALLASDHVARDVLLVELALDLDDYIPCLGFVLGEVVLRVLDEQGIDVDDVALDKQVIRALAQLD